LYRKCSYQFSCLSRCFCR